MERFSVCGSKEHQVGGKELQLHSHQENIFLRYKFFWMISSSFHFLFLCSICLRIWMYHSWMSSHSFFFCFIFLLFFHVEELHFSRLAFYYFLVKIYLNLNQWEESMIIMYVSNFLILKTRVGFDLFELFFLKKCY